METIKMNSASQRYLSAAQQWSRRPSSDLTSISTIKVPTQSRPNPNPSSTSPAGPDGYRAVRFSSLSSSYTQFLKQRDPDKVKKTVSLEVGQP